MAAGKQPVGAVANFTIGESVKARWWIDDGSSEPTFSNHGEQSRCERMRGMSMHVMHAHIIHDEYACLDAWQAKRLRMVMPTSLSLNLPLTGPPLTSRRLVPGCCEGR